MPTVKINERKPESRPINKREYILTPIDPIIPPENDKDIFLDSTLGYKRPQKQDEVQTSNQTQSYNTNSNNFSQSDQPKEDAPVEIKPVRSIMDELLDDEPEQNQTNNSYAEPEYTQEDNSNSDEYDDLILDDEDNFDASEYEELQAKDSTASQTYNQTQQNDYSDNYNSNYQNTQHQQEDELSHIDEEYNAEENYQYET